MKFQEVAMPVLEVEATICANDGCSRRFNLGWDGICEECSLVTQDHYMGLHEAPVLECRDCW
jgi:hypothetical protein